MKNNESDIYIAIPKLFVISYYYQYYYYHYHFY